MLLLWLTYISYATRHLLTRLLGSPAQALVCRRHQTWMWYGLTHTLPHVAMILGSSGILRNSLFGMSALSPQTLVGSPCNASMAW